MLSDLGGAASVALLRIGDALGLYKTCTRATRRQWRNAETGVNRRDLREWLSHQASNYLP
jgi:hypothetical protein